MAISLYKAHLHILLFLAFFGPNLHYGVDLTYSAGAAVICIATIYLHKITVPTSVPVFLLAVLIAIIFTSFVQVFKQERLIESYMASQYLKFIFFFCVAYGAHIIMTEVFRLAESQQIMMCVNYIVISAILTLFVGFFFGEVVYREYVNLHLYQISMRRADIILSRFSDLSIGGAAISVIYAAAAIAWFAFHRYQSENLWPLKSILAPIFLFSAVILTGRTGIVLAAFASFYFLMLNLTNTKMILKGIAFASMLLLMLFSFGESILIFLGLDSGIALWVLELFQQAEIRSFDVLIAGLTDIDLRELTVFGSTEQILVTQAGWRIDSLLVTALYSNGVAGFLILASIMFYMFLFVSWRHRRFNVLAATLLMLLVLTNLKEEFFGGVRGGIAIVMFMLINCSSISVRHRLR